MRKAYTIKSGLIAIFIYILIILIAVLAFVQNEKDDKTSGGKEQAIKVDMSGIDMSQNQKLPTKEEAKESKKIENIPSEIKEPTQEEPKEVEKPNKPEISKEKETAPKSIPDKKTKEKSDTNTTVKKINIIKKISKDTSVSNKTKDTASLFETVNAKAPTHNIKKISTASQKQIASTSNYSSAAKASSKASDLVGSSTSIKTNGVEEGYRSKVRSILNGWPAQSDFAGNKAKIKFVIEPNGRFEFDVIDRSSNEEFNKGLIQYLKQLQKVGFGAHGGGRAYVFDVDFIAER
jgi:protein TonB